MEDKDYENISRLASELISLAFVLNACCKSYMEYNPEIAQLTETTTILYKKTNELFDYL